MYETLIKERIICTTLAHLRDHQLTLHVVPAEHTRGVTVREIQPSLVILVRDHCLRQLENCKTKTLSMPIHASCVTRNNPC
jgi:hypothetical protein